MLLRFNRRIAQQVVDTTSALLERIQRLEADQAELRARLEGKSNIRFLTTEIAAAAEIAPLIGAAFQAFAQEMRAPRPRGRAGGIGRARTAWRYSDGTFMSDSKRESAIEDFEFERYERFAAGGRARAATATRNDYGQFLRARGSQSPQ